MLFICYNICYTSPFVLFILSFSRYVSVIIDLSAKGAATRLIQKLVDSSKKLNYTKELSELDYIQPRDKDTQRKPWTKPLFYEKVLHSNHCMCFVDFEGISDGQFGLKKKRRTIDAISKIITKKESIR